MTRPFTLIAILALTWSTPALWAQGSAGSTIDHVVLISVDGLRPDAVTNLGATLLPNFYRFRIEGAGTENARADADQTITVPNHVSMVTGYPVQGALGHGWLVNSDPLPTDSIHGNTGTYIPSAFDVAHDHGKSTALYASKSKLALIDQSYDAINGAPDTVGADDGHDKIDLYVFNADIQGLVSQYAADLSAYGFGFSMLHIADSDLYGHGFFFDATPGSPYTNQLQVIDSLLGQVFAVVENDPILSGTTAIILTSDHGGVGNNHVTPSLRENYTIPFHVWGPGVAANTDPYFTNPTVRTEPGVSRPNYSGSQPIRSGDAANLAMTLLGLPDVLGASINPSIASLNILGVPNVSPVALATAATTSTPFEVQLDGSGSTDPDGSISQWIWWLSDNTLHFGSTLTHTFAGPGSYTATLLVRDDRGGSALSVASVQLTQPANMPPVVLVAPPSGPVTAAQSFDVTLSDPDGFADLSGFQINVQLNGQGAWYQLFLPELLQIFNFSLDAQGRLLISWPDMGIWTHSGYFTSWNFRVMAADSAGHIVTIDQTYTPAP